MQICLISKVSIVFLVTVSAAYVELREEKRFFSQGQTLSLWFLRKDEVIYQINLLHFLYQVIRNVFMLRTDETLSCPLYRR